MLLQVAKMSEELVPDPPDFRVYISLKTGSVGGCSGPKTSRLGLRNLGLGSEGILIYTLGGVFGGFQGKKRPLSGPRKAPSGPPPATLWMEGFWTPTAQTLNGQVRSAYSTLRLLRRPPSGPIPSRRAWSGPPGTPSGPLREDPLGFCGIWHFWHFGRFTVNRPKRQIVQIQEDDQDPGNRGLGRILVSLWDRVRLGT